jgi:hypothetical protein
VLEMGKGGGAVGRQGGTKRTQDRERDNRERGRQREQGQWQGLGGAMAGSVRATVMDQHDYMRLSKKIFRRGR